MFHCDVVDIKNISLDKAQKFIESHKCGASLFFIGTVRDHNNEKEVTGITYDSHDVMVKKSFEEIYNEAIKKLSDMYCILLIKLESNVHIHFLLIKIPNSIPSLILPILVASF